MLQGISEGWHEDFELESRRQLSQFGEMDQTPTPESQGTMATQTIHVANVGRVGAA